MGVRSFLQENKIFLSLAVLIAVVLIFLAVFPDAVLLARAFLGKCLEMVENVYGAGILDELTFLAVILLTCLIIERVITKAQSQRSREPI